MQRTRVQRRSFKNHIYSRGKIPVLVGGTSYYIESIIYNYLVRKTTEDVEDDDDDDCGGGVGPEAPDNDDLTVDLSAKAFQEYAMFRNVNDVPTADTVDGAGRMYADTLAEAVRFVRTMAAVGRLPFKRYRNTFVAADDERRAEWPSTVVDCETAAVFAHGVRVLDAVAGALRREPRTPSVDEYCGDGGYEVSVADVVTGHRERYARAHVMSRLDAVLAAAGRAPAVEPAVTEALCRTCAELEKRTQRLALALLVDNERTACSLLSPNALKVHASYFDPLAAKELHPHNVRKVFRTIQIYLMRGKQKSKFFQEQRIQVNGSDVPVVTLRFKEVHMMWLTCDVDVLNNRLEKRTDEMVKRGLVGELCEFKNQLVKSTGTKHFRLDFTKGVLQCIGVKQFQQYLELSEDSRRTEKGRKALEDALTAMKYVTKKYARRQMRWINNRFLKSGDKQAVSVYRLDCTDLADWQRLTDQAVDLAKVVLGRKPRTESTLKPMEITEQKNVALPVYGDYYCNDCSRLFSNDIQYNIHLTSKKHARVMKKRKRKLQDITLNCDSDDEDKSKTHKSNS
ncbi:uncharacterized protein LOC112687878 isoform X2 [Sipha flava]|uniref:Uncharacterized protein LOC112687878 isoform X2 n=1 Tax=Sipha flava TaxID=143950 RepID=A0A8B8G1V3_9HEMI|nr:uncharacterized protein LOC112687878 isoform X2 [Sipha flava]